MKNLLVLVLALLLIPLGRTVVAAPAPETTPGPTEKLTRLHFKGAIQSKETYVMISPIMSVTAAGSGNATQLGQFTIHYELDMNVLDLSETGSVYFAGTNGDSIHAEGIGQAVPTVTPDLFNIVEIYNPNNDTVFGFRTAQIIS